MDSNVLVGLVIYLFLSLIGMAIWVSRTRMSLKKHKERQLTYKAIVNQSLETFARAIDAKDQDTNGHSIRVAEYSREIARRMQMSEEEQEQIYYMGMLHDIGKIGIPDSILKKPDKLTSEEMEVIRSHPSIGGDILKDFTAIEGISEGARYHHERYDGQGYNEGLKGEEIPLFARIICIADCYDTMSSKRVYKENLDEEYILNEFEECSGKQFDPNVVPYMIDMIQDGTVKRLR